PPRRQRLVGRWAKRLDGGIGANMALRREALAAVGGFDLMLGAGGYFPSGEDFDMSYRVLAAGYALLHLPEATVVHHGLRDRPTTSHLMRRAFMSISAAYMKHARLRDPVGTYLVLVEVAGAVATVIRSLVQLRRPI